MANIPEIQKALYPHIPKFDPSSPLNIYKNIPYPLNFLATIPVSLETLPGPHIFGSSFGARKKTTCFYECKKFK